KTCIVGIFIAVCDKIRSAYKIQQQILYEKRKQKTGFCYRTSKIGRELPPDNILSVFFIPSERQWNEGLNTVFPRIVLQQCVCSLTGIGTHGRKLDLYQQWYLTIDQFQYILKQRYFFFCVKKGIFLQFLVSHFTYRKINAAHSCKSMIMKNYQLLVLGKLYIQFYTVTMFYRIRKGGHRIFRNPLIRGKKTSVGKKMMDKFLRLFFPGQPGHDAVKIKTKKQKQDNRNN